MKNLFKKTIYKETQFRAFLQVSNNNLSAIRGGENPPPMDDDFSPPPPLPNTGG